MQRAVEHLATLLAATALPERNGTSEHNNPSAVIISAEGLLRMNANFSTEQPTISFSPNRTVQTIKSPKPKRPAGMSGRQWKKARKAARRAA